MTLNLFELDDIFISFQLVVDYCKPKNGKNPCLNGGVCTSGILSYICTCPDGYFGAYCEYMDEENL